MKKTIIITGGGKGIGAEITKVFTDEGYYVVVGSRSGSAFISKLRDRVRFVRMDVKAESGHDRLIKTARQWTGRLDGYINCAGFSGWKRVGQINDKFWNEMIDTNLKGVMWGCKAAAKGLKNGGSIVNISSLAGRRGSANNSVYCASKFGVTGLTQSLAKELGPRGIRVNAVCPVYVRSDGLVKALKGKNSPASGKNINSYLKEFARKQTALGRLPTGDEVAKACLFLISDQSSGITGQSIHVDCGCMPQ